MKMLRWLALLPLLTGCATLLPTADQDALHAQFAYVHRMGSGPTPPAQQVINIGASPNDGTGDPLRTAFGKDNTNVGALFSMFGTSSNLFTNGSALATDIAGLFTGCNSGTPALGYLGTCVSGGSGGGISGATNTIACNNTGSTGALSACTPQSTIGALDSPAANSQAGALYTLVLGDANGTVTMGNAGANVVCIPPNSSVNFGPNDIEVIEQIGSGVTTVAPAGVSGCVGSGVQLQSAQYGLSSTQTYSLGGQYGYLILQQTATNVWQLTEWNTPVLASRSGGSMAVSGSCTVSASTLSGTSGVITMGGAGGCTLTLTVSGAPPGLHGVVGSMGDGNQSTLPAWRGVSSTASSITFNVPAAVSSGDVLNVGPLGWY